MPAWYQRLQDVPLLGRSLPGHIDDSLNLGQRAHVVTGLRSHCAGRRVVDTRRWSRQTTGRPARYHDPDWMDAIAIRRGSYEGSAEPPDGAYRAIFPSLP